jgi:hypothetical protein
MNYFQYQNLTDYTFGTTTVTLTNITERAKIAERLAQYTTVMYDYIIEDEQRPDTVAQLVYGDVRYTWLVLLINNIMTLYDWPLTTDEFTQYLIQKYGSLSAARSGTPTYYTTDGVRVDATTYGLLATSKRGEVLTPYEQEERDNEAKRRIRVVPVRFLSSIEQAIKTLYR